MGEKIWNGINKVPFVILLVTDSLEFLVNHPYPSDDFKLSEDDKILNTKILYRKRLFPDFYLATFFKSDSSAILVLSGVIVSGVMRSVLGMLKYAMDTETQLPSITYWELGSLSDMTFQKLLPVLPGMAVAMAVLFAMRWQFNLLSLGDGEARSLGVNVAAVRGVSLDRKSVV